MELRAGYKATEVGVIPEDWEVAPLESFTSFISYGFTNPMPTSESGVYMVTAKDINNGHIQFDTARCTTEDAYRTQLTAKSRPKEHDLLLTKDGTLGRLALVDDRTICINQSVAILRPNEKAVPKFLKVLLEAPTYQARMLVDAGGSTIRHIYITIINQMPLAVPPTKAEQRAIATALSDVDALIAGLDRLIAKKRDLKQAAMQQLLTGQVRLPGFGGEWEVTRLGSLGKCLRGVSYRGDSDLSSYDTERTVRLLRANNVQDGVVVTSDVQFVSVDRVAREQVLLSDDIVICMANGSKDLVGKAARFNVVDGHRYTFGAFMGCYRTTKALASPSFVSLLFQTGYYRGCIANLIAGSSINNLRPGSIESLEFRVPDIDEQRAIAAVLSDMDAEIAALEARRDKTRLLKQGMMQELLTGRVRLV